MKNIFLSFLILSFSPIAWGDEDASCAPSPLTFAPEALVKTACTVDKKPELINIKDDYSNDGFTIACKKYYIEIVEFLLNIKPELINSFLIPCNKNYIEICRTFIKCKS